MRDNIFSNMTEEERKLAWMYKIFDKDMIKAKTEQLILWVYFSYR